jgi:hypothetical protein
MSLPKILPLENQANFKPSRAADSFFTKCKYQKLIAFSAVLPTSFHNAGHSAVQQL